MRGSPTDGISVEEAKRILEEALALMTKNHIGQYYCSHGTIHNILNKKQYKVDSSIVKQLQQAISRMNSL